MANPAPVPDLDAEASQVSVQPVPGAVFVRLRQQRADGSVRRMFAEMTIREAVALRRELDACISIAAAADGR
ncbi:MAG TPA: hypothetical protein VFW75_09420 [Acetobacteraceae bacterium]|nr:hypothetical protein [Acetobacteraceae bacterium]